MIGVRKSFLKHKICVSNFLSFNIKMVLEKTCRNFINRFSPKLDCNYYSHEKNKI
jgi:hypothetical protein